MQRLWIYKGSSLYFPWRTILELPWILHMISTLWFDYGKGTSQIVIHCILKYIKLAEIVIVQVIGSMEDEHTFNTISFMRSKFKNRFTSHLDLVIYMFSQHFYILENFAYDVIQEWKEMCVWYGDDTQLLDF
jgi:hypothetical protein